MQKKLKSKKEYLCDSCASNIKKGDIYELTKLKLPRYALDSEIQIGLEYATFRSCISCVERVEKAKLEWIELEKTDEYQYQQSILEHKYP
jgi:hypothetical protein